MSETNEYDVKSPNTLAMTEPPADFYRRRLRDIGSLLADKSNGSNLTKAQSLIEGALLSPRSNGEAMDALEREVAELRGAAIDISIARKELVLTKLSLTAALLKAELLEEKGRFMEKRIFESCSGPLSRFVSFVVLPVANRIDESFAEKFGKKEEAKCQS